MKKMKIILFSVLSILVLAGLGTASWMLYTNSTVTGRVISSSEIISFQNVYTEAPRDLNTTAGSDEIIIDNNIINQNGNLTLKLNYDLAVEDVNDTCDNTGDLTALVKVDGIEYQDGDNVYINSGITPIETIINAVPHACPQNYEVYLELNEV